MQRIIRTLLTLIMAIGAVTCCGVCVTFACDEAAINYNMEEIPVRANNNNCFRPLNYGTKSPEATMYKCASPALRAKPLDSPGPIIWAVTIASLGIAMILRKRKASMLVLGASLSGLFAAIGYLWKW